MVRLRFKLAGIAALILLIGLALRRCDRAIVSPTAPGALKPGERERVDVSNHQVTIITPTKTTKEYVPGKVDVSIDKLGHATVHVRELGLMLEPGMGTGYDGVDGKLVLDVKVAYYHRAGLNAGLAFDLGGVDWHERVKSEMAISYVPLVRLANTSLFVGTELFPQRAIGGIRVSF